MRRSTIVGGLAAALLLAGLTPSEASHAAGASPQSAGRGAPVTLEGKLVQAHEDTFAARPLTVHHFLETATGRVELKLPANAPEVSPGRKVRVRGKNAGPGKVDVAAGGVEVLAADGSASDAPTSGGTATMTSGSTLAATPTINKRLAVLLVNFATDTRQPWTRDYVNGLYFTNASSVANYFREQSYGKMALTGSVYGYLTISADRSTCGYSAWSSAARTKAAAAGINLSGFTNVAFVFPRQAACAWHGMGNMPGSSSWINGVLSLHVTAHELGHNFGVHHASSVSCTNSSGVRVAISTSCTTSEYGDPFDMMGSAATRHNQAWHRYQLGYLASAEMRTITMNGTYTVGPAASPASTPKVLRVRRPDGRYLYLEYRRPYGSYFDNFATTDAVTKGVTVRIGGDTGAIQSKLIDTTPSTTTFSDASLQVGKTFLETIAKITVTTTAVSTSGATVRIVIGSASDTTAPTTPGSFAARATSPTSAALSWTPSSDNVNVAGYRVYRNGTLVATATSTSYTASGLTAGASYTFAVRAFDPANNVSAAASAAVTMPTAADTTAPSTPGAFSVTATTATTTALSWTASTDNVRVTGYRVYRDGTLVGTTTNTSHSDSGLTEGRDYSYSVVAFDAAGNASTAATATVRMPDVTAPGTPTELAATASGFVGSNVSWRASSDNVAVAGYRVLRDGAVVATTSATSISETGLVPGSTYTYAVEAFDAAGNVSPRATTSLTMPVPDTIAPSKPADLSAWVGRRNRVNLSWSPATDNVGVVRYVVYRGGERVGSTSDLRYQDRPDRDNALLTYAIVAVDAAGNRSEPATIQVSTN